LLMVTIPQPAQKDAVSAQKISIREDISFGWRYLVARRGLLGLLFYFAAVNFLANISGSMVGPLVLSFSSAASMGFAQTMMGLGMLSGSLLMSLWGGPKKHKMRWIIGAISLASLGFIVAGSRPSLPVIAAGLFILLFFIPFGSGTSSAVFAAKVRPEVQGRVFATRSMVSQSMMPLAFILSGVLADNVFNPLLVEGGALASSMVGRWIGIGPGRGIGLMMICSGFLLLLISAIAYINPRIRKLDSEIPDVITDESPVEKEFQDHVPAHAAE